jgi:glycosyltransferase involved in cell wall biosynthesis
MRHGEDLATHYASGDLFLFPSTTETFGNVVTEAMASGLLVLAFDYAAARELIKDGVNGCTVPLGDGEAFLQAARRLVDDQGRWTAMRHNARATAMDMSWDTVVSQFETHLESVTH